MRNWFERVKKIKFLEVITSGFLLYIISIYIKQVLRVDTSSAFTPFVDDAFIHLRFIHHFAQGNGFVWNIGETPVEGFTSFLYVVFLGLFERLGGTPIHILPFIGVGSTILIFLMTLWLLELLNPDHRAENLVAVSMLGLSPQLRFWSFSGLEITFYTFLLVLTIVVFIGYRRGKYQPWLVGILFGILALVRPESLGLFVVTVVYDACYGLWERKLNTGRLILLLLSFAVIFLPVLAWKWWYFGYPFPNTYYAKTGAGWIQIAGGAAYVMESLKQIIKGSLIPVFLAVLTFRWHFNKDRLYLIVFLAALCGIVVLNGGDHFGYARFLVPGLPFIFALVAIGLSEITAQLPLLNKSVLSLVIFAMTFLAWNPYKSFINEDVVPMQIGKVANKEKLEFFNNWDAGFIIMGRTLNRIAEPTDTIAVVPIGAIGYYSGINVLDMVGLVDPVIAHEPFDMSYVSSWRPGHDKGDGAYILRKRPKYIQLVDLLSSMPYSKLLPSSEQYKSIVEIWNSPEFLELYEFYPVEVEGGWYYNLYRLKTNQTSS